MQTAELLVSQNRREGSLREASLDTVLASCFQHRLTGKILIAAKDQNGELELNAGVVDAARFGDLSGKPALSAMFSLRDGDFTISQRLPDLDGKLGASASFDVVSENLSLVAVMRHCEQNALTCVVIVVSEFDRGEIHYRLGDITAVTLNGERDEDLIVPLVNLKNPKIRVVAPPLEPSLTGWPAAARESTAPFLLAPRAEEADATPRRRARVGRAALLGLSVGGLLCSVLYALSLEAPRLALQIDEGLRSVIGILTGRFL